MPVYPLQLKLAVVHQQIDAVKLTGAVEPGRVKLSLKHFWVVPWLNLQVVGADWSVGRVAGVGSAEGADAGEPVADLADADAEDSSVFAVCFHDLASPTPFEESWKWRGFDSENRLKLRLFDAEESLKLYVVVHISLKLYVVVH